MLLDHVPDDDDDDDGAGESFHLFILCYKKL
jgi:hypothetical protein